MASEAHAQRLRGLYVDASDELAPAPRATITPDQAESSIRLADATLSLAELHRFEPLSDEEEGNMLWFFEAVDDPEKRKLVLGGPSLRKMAELHGGRAWIGWVREQFDHAEEEGRALAEQEIARSVGGGDDEVKEKWKLQVRIFSDSHSVRAKALQGWNESIDWLKLIYAQKKNQFLVEITFPRRMHIGTLYDAGFSVMQDFVLALNIGTGGFFWWYLPEYISKYYQSARDLESGSQVAVELTPQLRVDWGSRALDQQELRRVKMCFAALVPGRYPRKDSPFAYYLTGLALLAKNDVLLRLEPTIYEQFYRALCLGLQRFGDCGPDESIPAVFDRVFVDLLGEHPGTQWVEWGESLLNRQEVEKLTLAEAGMMKALCDVYFQKVLAQSLRSRASAEGAEGEEDEI